MAIGFYFQFWVNIIFFQYPLVLVIQIDQYSLILVRFPFNISYKDIMLNFNIKDILFDVMFVKYPRLLDNKIQKIQHNNPSR